MYNQLHEAILATIAYSDVFDYPLTQDEVWKYLMYQNDKYQVSNIKYQKELEVLIKSHSISKVGEYYCLVGKEQIVADRKRKQLISKKNLQKAHWISNILSYIPTLSFIGISGSLAMENIDSDGDIDLFFITSPHTIWITRFMILICLQILGLRRKRSRMAKSGDVCANMLLDRQELLISKEKQNIYTAHEIAQLKPVMSKNGTYIKFVQSNYWVKKYLPNVFSDLPDGEIFHSWDRSMSLGTITNSLFSIVLSFFEPLAHFFQYNYMKKHITSETISNTLLAFHPINYEKIILAKYKKRLKRLKIDWYV